MAKTLDLKGLPCGTQAEEADDMEHAIHIVRCELDLIEEGQEAADCYTPAQVRQIRKWLAKHS